MYSVIILRSVRFLVNYQTTLQLVVMWSLIHYKLLMSCHTTIKTAHFPEHFQTPCHLMRDCINIS